MAATTTPIFTTIPKIQWSGNITAANNIYDCASGTVNLIFTADATDGSFVRYIRGQAAGTNVATVARIFINNGSATTTAANNVLFMQVSLPATTASASAATTAVDIPLNLQLPASYRLYFVLGTAVAAGWNLSAVGGDY